MMSAKMRRRVTIAILFSMVVMVLISGLQGQDQIMKESIFVIAMGIVLWIIALVFAIVMNADSKVLWICVAGAVFGAVGLRYTIKRGRKGLL